MSLEWVTVSAPAKVNLVLRVLGRRPDGYHEVETLMVAVDVRDTVTLGRTGSGESLLRVTGASEIPVGEENLAMRALRLLERAVGRPLGVAISLEKRIPSGAGLGGGSSDAAAVLAGVDRLEGLGLPGRELEGLGAELGSDVAFFLRRRACWCRGRGERLEEAEWKERLPLLLLKPAFPVSTPEAYGRWSKAREIPGLDYGPQVYFWGELVNDLERPVFEKYLYLALLKDWLRRQPEVEGALLSGSGSTIYAVLRSEAGGAPVEARARAEFGPDLWAARCWTLPEW